jgi:hypothetical protein
MDLIDTKKIDDEVVERFFSNYDEEQNVLHQILSANTLKRFKAVVAQFGRDKVSQACIMPRPARIHEEDIFELLNSVGVEDFI